MRDRKEERRLARRHARRKQEEQSAPVDQAIERMTVRQAAAEAADERRRLYLKGLSASRKRAIGKSGKSVDRFQRLVYTALGLSQTAGFDGRPPAFLPDEQVNEKSAAVGGGFRNVVRDPLRRLHRRGEIDDVQYKGANAFISLWEAKDSGLRGIAYGERVDGGKMPDVSEKALYTTRLVSDVRMILGQDAVHLLELVCVAGLPIYRVAEIGRHGRDSRTVLKRVKTALNKVSHLLVGGVSGRGS